MFKIKQNRIIIPIVFLLLLLAYLAVLSVIPDGYNDMREHAAFAREMLTGIRPTAGNFLFYWLVNIFSFFSTNIRLSEISLCFLLAFATTYRYYLTQKKITDVIYHNQPNYKNYWISVLAAFSLLFVFAIPIPSYTLDEFLYIGNFVPNVWHNSTVLFVFPFALLLFEQSYKQLTHFNTKRNVLIILLIFLNVFIKPSYFFVFVCVYPLFLLIKYKLKKEFWQGIIPVVLGLFFLVFEFWTIYLTKDPFIIEKSSVIFQPFYSSPLFPDLWPMPIAFFFSLFFPILYTLFNLSKVKNSQLFWFSTLSFIVSVFIYLFIAETGPRATHGNFYWQIVICTWISFFVALLALLKDFKIEGKTLKNKFLMSTYFLQFLMGIFYFVRLVLTGNYY